MMKINYKLIKKSLKLFLIKANKFKTDIFLQKFINIFDYFKL